MSFTWGTVTQVSPLRITLDGDTTALPFAPDSLVTVTSLAVDDRVRCEITSQKVVIGGRSTGVTPAATTTVKGIVELATDAETITGTDTTRAVTPAGLAAVSAALDSGWITATLNSGWTTVTVFTVAYRKLNGVVYVKGRATSTGASQYVFTLPSGFKPADQILFLAEASGAAVRCQVSSGIGQATTAAVTNLSLTTVPAFIAEA